MKARGNACKKARCKKPGTEAGLCRTHLKQECDRLFSLIVRSRGGCEVEGKHVGNLQTMHGFSRRYLGVRWDERNAFCGCAGHHMAFTHDPIRWDLWMLDRLGLELYGELRGLALSTDKTDLVSTYDELVLRAREMELV